jgi:hypothetical protein
MDPIVLHPANTDVSNAMLDIQQFDTDGTPDPNGILASLVVSGTTQGDDTFAVPGASGCGPNGDGTLDTVVNAVVGLPSPSGANHRALTTSCWTTPRRHWRSRPAGCPVQEPS